MAEFEIVIRGGTVVDGTGSPARTADVAISGGRIVEVGTHTELLALRKHYYRFYLSGQLAQFQAA